MISKDPNVKIESEEEKRFKEVEGAIKIYSHNANSIKDEIIKKLGRYIKIDPTVEINKILRSSKDIETLIDDINNNELKDDNSSFSSVLKDDLEVKKRHVSHIQLKFLKDKVSNNKKIINEFLEDFTNRTQNISAKIVSDNSIQFNTVDISRINKSYPIYKNILEQVKSGVGDGDYYFENYFKKINQIEGFNRSQIQKEEDKDPRDILDNMIDDELQKSKESSTLDEQSANKAKKFEKDIKPALSSSADKEINENPNFDEEDKTYMLKELYTNNTSNIIHSNLKQIISTELDLKEKENNLPLIGKLLDVLSINLENSRDELFVDEYVLGMFKNSLYEKETDLRGRPKKDLDVFFNKAETEYVLTGNSDEIKSVESIKTQILLIRFALNTMYLYVDRTKNAQALAAATEIAGFSGFGVPLVHTAIILAWAMAESVLDVKYLIQGREMPLFKTSQTWILGGGGLNDCLKDIVYNKTREVANNTIDSLKDRYVYEASNIVAIFDEKIEQTIDKAFIPIDKLIADADNYKNGLVQNISEDISNRTDFVITPYEDETMNEIQKDIYNKVIDKFNTQFVKLKSEFLNGVKASATEPIDKFIKEFMQEVNDEKTRIKNLIKTDKSIMDKINGFANKTASSIKSQINNKIDLLSEKTSLSKKGAVSTIDFKGGLITLSYQDYLRILLLTQNSDKKISRIQDLIELNIRKSTKNDDFKLLECNTYLRVTSLFSIKYLFLTKLFAPKEKLTMAGSRYKLDMLVYKGY